MKETKTKKKKYIVPESFTANGKAQKQLRTLIESLETSSFISKNIDIAKTSVGRLL
jgi:hypothetical protein